MKHVIIGTAGHVDHGKTTLIKALTGTDTDRLKEEQERGMTIDLGFAALPLPDGTRAGIVDVPGHERFLKNMLAGAGGVDVVLLVVAADESVMPQTVEHLDILRLLDVHNGVVALTKCGVVDPDWIDVVEEDVRGRLKDTFLADAPIVRVDSLSGQGIPELKQALYRAIERADARNAALPFRVPVDRVFTRPGFGTVITGTLVAGTLRVGDAAEVLPQRIQTRVRGLQSHGRRQEAAEAGTRVAVNLAGVDIADLERGAVLVAPGSLQPTQTVDATLRLLPTVARPLANRTRVRLYIGTAEVLGRVILLDRDALEPGGTAYVQFRGETPFACGRGDRFVVRTYSPMATVAGGIVLDPAAAWHRRRDANTLASLQAKERGAPEDILATWLLTQPVGAALKDAARTLGILESTLQEAAETLAGRGEAVPLEGARVIHRSALAAARDRAQSALEAFHRANPLRPGMPREELRGALGRGVDPRAFLALLARWQDEGLIVADPATVRLAGFSVTLDARQQAILDRLVERLRTAGINVPSVEELAESAGAAPETAATLLRVGMDQGTVVRVAEGLYFHRETLEEARRTVRDWIREHGAITVSQFRDLTGSSRKYALPILEHFDSVRFTRRLGDNRVLLDG